MPAYNEEEAISNVIQEWSEIANTYEGNLAVFNDGSSDSTLEKLQQLKEQFPRLIVIDKPNSGHGPTCLTGYHWAKQQGYEWVFQTDSDGQARTDEFPLLWEKKEHHPFVFGNRPTRGDGKIRYYISRTLQTILLFIFSVSIKDANVPYRLMKIESLSDHLDYIPKDFFLANALLSVILEKNQGIHWVPIYFGPRSGGVPSVSLKRFFSLGIKTTLDFIKVRNLI